MPNPGIQDCPSASGESRTWTRFIAVKCDAASGRRWARVEDDGTVTGHIYFHLGEAAASDT